MSVLHIALLETINETMREEFGHRYAAGFVWTGRNIKSLKLSFAEIETYTPHELCIRDNYKSRISVAAVLATLSVPDAIIGLMYYTMPETAVSHPVGFMMAQMNDGSRYINLDLLCAAPRTDIYKEHNGKMLLYKLFAYAHSRGVHEIRLDAVEDVVAYYPKFGFNFRETCKDQALRDIDVKKDVLKQLLERFPEQREFPMVKCSKRSYNKVKAEFSKSSYDKVKAEFLNTWKSKRIDDHQIEPDGFAQAAATAWSS
jgi:hypothetical protein